MEKKTKKLLLATVSYSLLQLASINSAMATNRAVTDAGSGTGAGTLREAITNAAASNTTDQIHFHSLVGTNEIITLGGHAASFPGAGPSTGATIGGSGATYGYGGTGKITISGGGTYKLADLTAAFPLTFEDVTLTSGTIALGHASAALTLKHSTDTTSDAVISGTGTLTKDGTGVLTLTGVNTYTGNTTVSAGKLKLDGSGALAAATGMTVSTGATLDLNGKTQTLDELAGAGTIALGAGSLTTSTSNSSTFSGALTGTAASSLTKADSGTLTLTGDNSGFLGTKTVSAGTVAGKAVSIGNIVNNSHVTFTDTTAVSYDGVVSGTGDLTMNGTGGTVTINKPQTHTGGTTISDGILKLGANNALPATGTVTVDGANAKLNLDGKSLKIGVLASGTSNGGSEIVLGTGTLTVDSGAFAGKITGAGKLAKASVGELDLKSGANTYTGGTEVQAGTLKGDTTSLQGNISVASGATVTFNQSGDGTYAGVISGAGNLVKSGADKVTLGADQTLTGTVTISAGTLSVKASTLPGNVVNNATLTFDQTTDGTYSKVISGTGAVTKAGTGKVTLSGTNTYTGATTISAGTLIGTTSSVKNGITNGGALVFDQNTDGTYAGVMSSTGTFEKKGTGTVTLSGTSTNNGAATITAGKVYVTGTIANATTTVKAGAELGGTGTTASIVNEGKVSFGTDPALTDHLTMSAAATYTQAATGVLHVKLGAHTVSDYLNVDSAGSGTATLAAGGKIVVYPKVGQAYAAGNTFDVMKTSAPIANPTNVTVVSGNLIPLKMTPSASANDLRLTIDSVPTPVTSLTGSSSAKAIITALSNSTVLNGPSKLTDYIIAINSLATDNEKVTAFETLAGGKRHGSSDVTGSALGGVMKVSTGALTSASSAATAAALVAHSSQNIDVDEVQSLLALNSMDVREEVRNASRSHNVKHYVSSKNKAKAHRHNFDGASMWMKGLYDRYNRDNSANNAGYKANTAALLVGRNMTLSPEDKLGFFGGYGKTNVKYKSNKGKTTAKHYLFGVNMAHNDHDTPITYGATVGLTKYNDKRNVVVGPITEVARSKHRSHNLALNGEIGKNIYQGDVLVKPKFGLELISQWHEAYSETGTTGNNLSFKKKLSSAMTLKPGVEVSRIIKQNNCTIMPMAGLTYSYTTNLGSKTNKQSLVGQGVLFDVRTKNDSKHALGLNLGLSARTHNKSEFGVKYEGTIRQKAVEHQFTLNAEWKL